MGGEHLEGSPGELSGVFRSPAEMVNLGKEIGRHLFEGSIVGLTGPLGAGKTCFVQGVCAGLGLTGEVVSPTFTLVNTYPGPPRVHHLDFYRVASGDDLADIGVPDLLDEVLDGTAVLLAEWPETLMPALAGVPFLELLVLPAVEPTARVWHLRGVPDAPPAAWRELFERMGGGAC